jgi:N-acetylglucosamine-6-sulfatase
MYPHNIHSTDGSGCMHMNVTGEEFVGAMMGKWLQKAGYVTGQFGKLLNNMQPYCSEKNAEILPGFDNYLTMCNYGRYFKNTFSKNGQLVTTGEEPSDYLTSVLGNATIDWMKSVLKGDKPLFAYVAPHAPHVPATPAPVQYGI